MALSKSAIAAEIKTMFQNGLSETDQATALDHVSTALAEIMAKYIRQGVQTATYTVTSIPALANGAGPVTGTITNTTTATLPVT